MAISSLEDFTQGSFQEVIDDAQAAQQGSKVTRVLFCSGKVYYDLLAEKQAKNAENTAIIRIEQLYPWPEARLAAILKQYPNVKQTVWVQEEPKNMGAYWYISQQMPMSYAGRAWAASPAVGSPKVHEQEFKAFIADAFSGELKK
jgi:2-oxoglutarate dehydrogenase E1 component